MIKVTEGSEDLFIAMVSAYILEADNSGVDTLDLEIDFVYENKTYRENLRVTGMNWKIGDAVAHLEVYCERVVEPDVKFTIDQHGLWRK